MLTLWLVLLTAACVILTVSFLGALRGVAELRLRIYGHGRPAGTTQMLLDEGWKLPSELLSAFPAPASEGLIAFLSDDCETCWRLADELRSFDKCPVVACIVGENGRSIEERLGDEVVVVAPEVARQVVTEMRIVMTPVAVFHRDGYIVGSAIGEGARVLGDIEGLWKSVSLHSKGGAESGRRSG